MKNVEIMYCIFLTAWGKGYGCFVFDKTNLQNGEIKIAASFCNPNDSNLFSKEQARYLAEDKLLDPLCSFNLVFDPNETQEDLESNEELADIYFESVDLPKWVQKCVYRDALLFTLKQDNLSLEDLSLALNVSHFLFQDLRAITTALPARDWVEYSEHMPD